MKKTIGTVLALILLVSLFSTVALAEEKIEIRFAWWGDQARHETYNAICDEFEAQYPDIKVIREPATWNDYWDKLATQVAGGNAPDVIGMHTSYSSDYAKRGALADLQPLVDKGLIDLSRVPEAVIKAGTFYGKFYALAQGVATNAYHVNLTLLEELGVEFDPEHNYTYEELAELGQKVREASKAQGKDIYLMASPEREITVIRFITYQMQGCDFFNPDGTIAINAETATAWFSYWNDLRERDIVLDAASNVEDLALPLEQKAFTNHRCVMLQTSANQHILYCKAMPNDKLSIMRPPVANDGTFVDLIDCPYNSIFSGIDEAHMEAAAKFINFFCNSKDSLKHLQMAQGAPANQDMYDFLEGIMDEPNRVTLNYTRMVIEDGKPYVPAPAGSNEINTLLSDLSEQVAFGATTPEEAGRMLVEQSQEIVARHAQ